MACTFLISANALLLRETTFHSGFPADDGFMRRVFLYG